MNSVFPVGSVVQLKAGGQPMTVIGRNGDDCGVAWVSSDGRLREHEFSSEVLMHAETIRGVVVVEEITCASPTNCVYRGVHGNA